MTGQLETCSECWAVVETQHLKRHQEWHDELASTARDASYAATMTRPIG